MRCGISVWQRMPKLFNFTLTDQSQRRLGRVCEQYVAAHLDYQPKSLEFLHGVLE